MISSDIGFQTGWKQIWQCMGMLSSINGILPSNTGEFQQNRNLPMKLNCIKVVPVLFLPIFIFVVWKLSSNHFIGFELHSQTDVGHICWFCCAWKHHCLSQSQQKSVVGLPLLKRHQQLCFELWLPCFISPHQVITGSQLEYYPELEVNWNTQNESVVESQVTNASHMFSSFFSPFTLPWKVPSDGGRSLLSGPGALASGGGVWGWGPLWMIFRGKPPEWMMTHWYLGVPGFCLKPHDWGNLGWNMEEDGWKRPHLWMISMIDIQKTAMLHCFVSLREGRTCRIIPWIVFVAGKWV